MTTFYHGTRRGFRPGGWLFPKSWHGGTGTSAPTNSASPDDASNYVFVTTLRTLAWVYAWLAPGRGKPKVLVVEPVGTVTRDPEHSYRMEAYRCESARVVKVLTEPEVTEEEARNGWAESGVPYEVVQSTRTPGLPLGRGFWRLRAERSRSALGHSRTVRPLV